jgi:hypothetical protein
MRGKFNCAKAVTGYGFEIRGGNGRKIVHSCFHFTQNPLVSVILSRLLDSLKPGNTRGVNFWAIAGIVHANP